MLEKPALLIVVLVALTSILALGQPQTTLRISVRGSGEAMDARIFLRVELGNASNVISCQLAGGECEIPVGNAGLTVTRVWFDKPLAVTYIRGTSESIWEGWSAEDRLHNIMLFVDDQGRVLSTLEVQPRMENGVLALDLDVHEACLVTIEKGSLSQELAELPQWVRWRLGIREDDERYYLVMLKGYTEDIVVFIQSSSRLAKLLQPLLTYGVSAWRWGAGLAVRVSVSCDKSNVSLGYLMADSLLMGLESYVESERALLSRIGFDADRYFEDVGRAAMLLRESKEAFDEGRSDVGLGLMEMALAKASLSLEALSQAKTDSIAMFSFLVTFTFFLSSIVSNAVERRRFVVGVSLFAALTLAELALIPQTRMAILFLSPDVISRSSPSTMALSLLTAALTLIIIGMLVFSAKGTILSDFFWYSVRNMSKRKLRALLTVTTVAVVSAVASSFLTIGTMTEVRLDSFRSSFQGVSISWHNTTVTYIFRGLDQANEVSVEDRFEPIPDYQVKWLRGLEWVKRVYVLVAYPALISSSSGRLRAFVAATNASGVDGVLVPRSVAERLGIASGDSVFVNGREFKVSTVFPDESPPTLADGVPITEVPKPFIIMGISPQEEPHPVYRLILEGTPPAGFAEDLIRSGYEKSSSFIPSSGAEVTVQAFLSYRACTGGEGETTCKMVFGEFQSFSGIPEFMVVLGLSSLTIAVTLVGSLYERRKEYSTISSLGGSPGHISVLLLVEGLSYGLIGGTAGYIVSQFLNVYVPPAITVIQPQVFSPIVACFAVAIVPSVIGSLIPARRAVLQVVPSRLILRRVSEMKIYDDHAEASIPLRIIGDEEEFAKYVESLVLRPAPMTWGPLYMRVTPHREDGRLKMLELVVSFRGERAAVYRVEVFLPGTSGATLRAVAWPATGGWSVDHKACAKGLLTSLRDDLLQYIDWKKAQEKLKGTTPG